MKCKVKGCNSHIEPQYGDSGRLTNGRQWKCDKHYTSTGKSHLERLRKEVMGHAKHNWNVPFRIKNEIGINNALPDDGRCPITGVTFDMSCWMGNNYPFPELILDHLDATTDNIRFVSVRGRELTAENYY